MTPIDTHIDHDESHAPDEAAREAAIRRRNRILVAVLIVLAIGFAFLAYPLFNNYWDPALSDQTISH